MSKLNQAKLIIAAMLMLTSAWVEVTARSRTAAVRSQTEAKVADASPSEYRRTRSRSEAGASGEDLRSPGEILRAARTMYIEASRRIDARYVQYKLLKTDQLAEWGITLVEEPAAADLILRLDQSRLNYLFTITDLRTSAVVVTGKVVAINDPVAADYLGREIIRRMREVRRTTDLRPQRKNEND